MRNTRTMIAVLATLIITYTAVLLLLPADPSIVQRFSLSSFQLILLKLSVVIPIALIWAAAFYGSVLMSNYSAKISATKEGKAYRKIALGLQILAIGSPFISISSNLLRYWATMHPDTLASTQILTHYLQLGVAAAAFYYIYCGAELLKQLTRKNPSAWVHAVTGLALALLTGIFCLITLNRTSGSVVVSSGQAVYYLPDWLIVASIIIPYAYVWHWGAKAAMYVHFYRLKVAGLIYRNAFNMLASGIGVVMLSSIATQYFTALGVTTRMQLQPLLIVIYLLLTLMAIGYILIALGSKRLQKIEDV